MGAILRVLAPALVVGVGWSLAAGQELIWQWGGEAKGDLFGMAVAGAGDVDADGHGDLLVGAPFNDLAGSRAGRVYLYSGSTGQLLGVFTGGMALARLHAVAGVGDVDQDGHDDFLLGAPGEDTGGGIVEGGRAYLYSGQTLTSIAAFEGQDTQSEFGVSLSRGGDLDLDGVPDLMLGAPYWASASPDLARGRVHVYSGRTRALLFELAGEKENDLFGWDLSDLGDVDDDGWPEFLVGAVGAGPSLVQGRVYVYSGRDATVLRTFEGRSRLQRWASTSPGSATSTATAVRTWLRVLPAIPATSSSTPAGPACCCTTSTKRSPATSGYGS